MREHIARGRALITACITLAGCGASDGAQSAAVSASELSRDVMLMNRIGPSQSELYVANADGSEERKLLTDTGFDYHASYSSDGKWIVFTSERAG